MTSVHDFIEQLSSGEPVPGGGSVAALQAALAASLLAMVCNLTLGRKKYAAVEIEVHEILTRALALRDRAAALVDEDAAAYAAVATAMAMPRTTDEETYTRRDQVQNALKAAALPPLETMRVAGEALELTRRLVDIGNTNAISDVGVAALAGRAAFHAARLNVEINLTSVQDGVWRQSMRDALGALAAPEDSERLVLDTTEAVIRGSAA